MTATVIPFVRRAAPEPRAVVYIQVAACDGWFEVVFQARPDREPVLLARHDRWEDADVDARAIEADQGAIYPDWSPAGGAA